MKSQRERILISLRHYKFITAKMMALDFDIWRTSGRIFELREAGHDIKTTLIHSPNGKVYARYSIEKPYTKTKRFKRLAKEYLENDAKL